MEIRIGTPDDIHAAAIIWECAHRERLGFVPEGARKERASAFLAEKLALGTSRFLVCEINGAIVGMLFALQARNEDGAGDPIVGLLHISYVAVAPRCWGKRIAAALIEQVENQAKSDGYQRSQLWAVPTNDRARRLYEGMGFRLSGREMFAEDFGEPIVHYEHLLDWDSSCLKT